MHPRRYETLLLIDPDIPQDDQEQIKQKFIEIINNMNGRLILTEDWGRRRLAYPVKKKMYGAYLLIDFMGSPSMLEELERNLRIDERIFKYMSQILDKSFTEEKFQQEMERLDAEKNRIEAERARRSMDEYDSEEDEYQEEDDEASEEESEPQAPSAEVEAESPAEEPSAAPVEGEPEAEESKPESQGETS